MTDNAQIRIPLEDLLVFHQLARSLTSSFDLDTILRTILEHMERIIDADLWTLLILDRSAGELYYALAAGGEQEALRGLRVKVGEGTAGWVAEHGETLIVSDYDDPRLKPSEAARMRLVQSVIALPLRGRKGTHGVIEIINPRAEQMTDYTIAFLHILADHAAIAIENAHDVTSIQQLTITDDCTGLFNARHLYHVLDRELKRSAGQGSPVSLAFLEMCIRDRNKATDVLSFPPEEFIGSKEKIAGDLAISVETARKQAAEQGHALTNELKILMLHGLLHLAGYDHETDDGAMARREMKLRAKLGLPQGLIERTVSPTLSYKGPRKDGARDVYKRQACMWATLARAADFW